VSSNPGPESFLHVFDAAPVPIHVVGRDGIILAANRAELALLGYRSEQYVGHHVTEFHVDRDHGAALVERIGRGEPLRDHAARLRCADGSVKQVRISSEVHDDGGRVVRTCCFTRDVSDAVAAERRLAVQYRVAQILANATDTVEGLERVLAAVCDELGWDVGEVWLRPDGSNALRLVASMARPGVDAQALATLGRDAVLAPDEDLPGHVWASGEPAWVADLAKASTFRRAAAAEAAGLRVACGVPIALAGAETGVMLCLRRAAEAGDETGAMRTLRLVAAQLEQFLARARVAAEQDTLLARERAVREEAEVANRAKDEFLAALSHELRTPLNAILGWSRLLRSGQLDGETVGRGLAAIERNAEIQEQLIADLLDVARIVTGKVELRLGPTDIAGVVEAAADAVRHAAAAKGQTLAVRVDRSIPATLADAHRLQQVVWNLLTNAIRFTPEGGHVRVDLTARGGRAIIQVVDDGVGIEPAFLPHVFDRFRQGDTGGTRRTGGLGLGLSIVRHLAELHGGLVRVESAGEGRGTTFSVDLPLLVPSEPAVTPATTPPPAPVATGALAGARILLVDDDADARDMLGLVLRQQGARVSEAASAEDAVAAFRAEVPDVLVSDIGLPDTDGYGLIRQLRALRVPHAQETVAVALTGWARSEDRSAALEAGYQAHVVKPIDPRELVALLARLVHGGAEAAGTTIASA
jgi:PAS domain S-box-containing protein